MMIKDGVPETAAALREKYGKETLNVSESAEAIGVSRQTIYKWNLPFVHGRIAVETLARIIVG